MELCSDGRDGKRPCMVGELARTGGCAAAEWQRRGGHWSQLRQTQLGKPVQQGMVWVGWLVQKEGCSQLGMYSAVGQLMW